MFLIPLWPGGVVAQRSGLASGPGGLQPLPTDLSPSGPLLSIGGPYGDV